MAPTPPDISTVRRTRHFYFGLTLWVREPSAGFAPATPSTTGSSLRSFLIEFDDTSAAADHEHVVWREIRADFGRDALAEHYRAHHVP